MENSWPELGFPQMKRVKQISVVHCGPAVIKMLLSIYGIEVKQKQIVEAAGAEWKLKTHGMTVAELGAAVKLLVAQMQLWFKTQATIGELARLVHEYGLPVGVEWQGVFEEYEDEDSGHYGVVTRVDTLHNVIMLADPFKKYAGKDRRFSVVDFERRWWDTNEIIDRTTGKRWHQKDDQMMFVVIPKEMTFPEELGMQRGGND